MWYEIFKFELKYRLKRPETYVFFGFLFLFSIVGVDFIFQGVELGLMKRNAPLVIAKTMGAITGIFMIMVSMIMGVPVLRDYQYDIEALLFVNPITKRDYLLGRFLGSFTILLFIFSGLFLGMVLGSQMPWHKAEDMLIFNALSYLQSFVVVVLPTLFFGACTFFVTGMLSKKLLIVYTQGIVLFVAFLLTKSITNEYLQGLLDPFSLTTLTQFSKDVPPNQLNELSISLNGILLHSKLFWMALGCIILVYGYRKFSFSVLAKKPKEKSKTIERIENEKPIIDLELPKVSLHHNFKAHCIQLFELTKFYTLSLLKETSFWAIAICGIIIILSNSVNLGTVFGVDSYPKTYFIIAELQEMSMYFFIIILLFYSGELIWKERNIKQYVLNDATPIHNFTTLASKFMSLIGLYMVLMFTLILTGILFQIASGFYEFQLRVYFSGFFVEILPFLILYTFISFFCQVLSRNKFIGIFLTLIFFILNVASEYLGFVHSLYKFGGKPLGVYSEMNGYGHFLVPYLWVKFYWMVFGILLLILSSLLMKRGIQMKFWKRIESIPKQLTQPVLLTSLSLTIVFILLGSYIFYNTNILNPYWTSSEKEDFRLRYEQILKPLEYYPQPKITDVKLNLELYPEDRSYEVEGSYILTNTKNTPIEEIHIQKLIASHVKLSDVVFEGGATKDDRYAEFDYSIYKLNQPLAPNAKIEMSFQQSYFPKGFEDNHSDIKIVNNGTFFNNSIFPTIGYNKKYELQDHSIRSYYELPAREDKAKIDNALELVNARSGGDSDGITLDITIGTSKNQTAVTSGQLMKQWKENDRNYFHYKTDGQIINFYSIVSAEYEIQKDSWETKDSIENAVDLSIFYHKGHDYNVDRMMDGIKASLSYYSEHFGPYQYQQVNIMEFPRYGDFAQSFPGAIPFSESLGFVLDIDDARDVDMAFYITAHEVAHQWFGMQVEGANVQGRNFILETLSQYGAIMVLKSKYQQEKVDQFLELQKETYNEKRRKAISEPSLALVENEDYVHYNKGVIQMYKLQNLIGEDQVNQALQAFIKDWRSYTGVKKSQTQHYATSEDLLGYFREVTPKEQHHVLYELFETNTDLKSEENNL
ncbi:M1 family aminopeptidase [Winogradskyella sp.]|uniref:ABC transporter permease/M1 family aminopeptidase n=1 Tax=Winogradskyella sp. TaxID=1883156 RepID=UPI003BABF59A